MTDTSNNGGLVPDPNAQQPVPPHQPAAPMNPGYDAGAQQAAPSYGAPGQQAAPGYGAPGQAPQSESNLVLNYWLSVVFSWLPALIFWIIDKDKGNAKLNDFQRENLNFSLLRVIVGFVTIIPYIGWIVGVLGGLVLFVFHIMAAAKVKAAYDNNEKPPFIFNIPIIK